MEGGQDGFGQRDQATSPLMRSATEISVPDLFEIIRRQEETIRHQAELFQAAEARHQQQLHEIQHQYQQHLTSAPVQQPIMAQAPPRATIETYAGTENVAVCIRRVEECFYASGSTELTTMHIRQAATYLRDAAWHWYDTRLRKTGPGNCPPFATWEALTSTPRSEFQHHQTHLRDQLRFLVQTGSVADYLKVFRRIAAQITDLSEAEKVDRFVAGLKKETREEIRYRDPKEFALAVKWPLMFDERYAPEPGRHNSRAVSSGTSSYRRFSNVLMKQRRRKKTKWCLWNLMLLRGAVGDRRSVSYAERKIIAPEVAHVGMDLVETKAHLKINRLNNVKMKTMR
jgi:hypothetical protein